MAQLNEETVPVVRPLLWSLCIATLNRQDVLLRTLEYAARQTRPPKQVVVVDVSDDWQDSKARATQLLAAYPDIELIYMTSPVRSSATQRNLGLEQCRNDIVFMIDDDSFMFKECAEEVMKIYEADTEKAVACVSARLARILPPGPEETGDDSTAENTHETPEALARKSSGRRQQNGLKATLMNSKFGRWVNRKVLLQNKDELFLKYDEPRDRTIPDTLKQADVVALSFMPGSAMTVRREVALLEPFDPSLRYYAAFEDLDATYRYARHGAILRANQAHLHHFEIAGGRVKRKKVIIFQLLNMLVFLKRHAAQPEAWVKPYRSMLWRRLIGETLKDGLSGRFSFPQAAGVVIVMRQWHNVWAKDVHELDDWYPDFQKVILEEL